MLNDVGKAEVELFDGKLGSLIPLQLQWYKGRNISTDSFEFIAADLATVAALYDATITVWRVKTEADGVRPTSVARQFLKGQSVKGWRGPGKGVGRIRGDEWVPYIRTMPHAEFPSASSCVCQAFAEVMRERTGRDEVQEGLRLRMNKGSSRVEEGVPSKDIELRFSGWDEVSKRCGRSRLAGGMHFGKAVQAGKQLCTGIGVKVSKAVRMLERGRRPDVVVDVKRLVPVRRKRC